MRLFVSIPLARKKTLVSTRSNFIASRQKGVALIIVLIMMVIIGLTASASMRGAATSEKMVNNMRSEMVAQQYAEAALVFCETEMNKASASRVSALQDSKITTVAVAGTALWSSTSTWVGGATKKYDIPVTKLKSTDSSVTSVPSPQCVVERQTLPDAKTAVIITARGFSPDYTSDSTTGATTAGSVVWLQSYLALN